MRHGKKNNHLGRTAPHRAAMLSNMATSLILHKRIETTLAKAKELRKYVEPMITRSKTDDTNNRRVVFSYLQSKEAIKELFGIVAEKVASRPGGYTRIIKLGNRLGDNASMCMMELVDFNETMLAAATETATKTRRSRRGGAKKEGSDAVVEAAAPVVVEEPSAEVVEETPSAEVVEETPSATVVEDESTGAESSGVTPSEEEKTAE